jgi:hypothetical protein
VSRKEDPRVAEARAWARSVLYDHLHPGTEMTCGEILGCLDADPRRPQIWDHLAASETERYKKRYHMVRKLLENGAREQKLVLGTTVNSKGREKSTTYAAVADRPKAS